MCVQAKTASAERPPLLACAFDSIASLVVPRGAGSGRKGLSGLGGLFLLCLVCLIQCIREPRRPGEPDGADELSF